MADTGVAATLALAGLGELADPRAFQGPIDIACLAPHTLVAHYRSMMTIRRAEEKIGDAVEERLVRCPAHLAIGQEAIPVGVSASLRSTDRIFGAHRSHGHFLAAGASLHSLFAEVLGRSTGASRGMGGSMHLWSGEHGFAGSVPIVAATVPIAVGAALAARMSGGDGIAVVYVGDGAFEEGVVHESLNLAAVMKLPVLFVAENNFFASHLHIRQRQQSDLLQRFAQANGIASALVDGNDVVQVAAAAASLVDVCRRQRTPGFLEAVTYRWRGHDGPKEDQDVGVDRKGDLANWRRRDPLARLRCALIEQGRATRSALDQVDTEVVTAIEDAWHEALGDPMPDPSQTLGCVYAPAVTHGAR